MPKQPDAVHTRERLIEATMQTVRSRGITGFTLDAVAKEAGVSKGGLLHHFHSKEALVEAVLRQLFADFEAKVQHYLEREPSTNGRRLRAYVRATFDDDPLPLALGAVLLLSLVENEEFLTLVQEDHAHWRSQLLEDGVPAARATIVRQAADAYWMERLIYVVPEDAATRRGLMEELLRLIEGDNA